MTRVPCRRSAAVAGLFAIANADPDPERLARIYQRPEFVWVRWTESVSDRIREVVWTLLLRLQEFLDLGSLRPVAWVAAGVLVAFAAGLLVWLTRRLQSAPVASAGAVRSAEMNAPDLEAEALRLASSGNWVAAIRQLLRALLVGLDRGGWLPYDPSRSNREVLRALRRRFRGTGDDLARLLAAADEVTFGGRSGSQPLWQEAEGAYRRLFAALTAEAEARAEGTRGNSGSGRPSAPGTESGVRP
ncbi:MAG: DUF4129 domain-containing protein [Bacillota bacterium]